MKDKSNNCASPGTQAKAGVTRNVKNTACKESSVR